MKIDTVQIAKEACPFGNDGSDRLNMKRFQQGMEHLISMQRS